MKAKQNFIVKKISPIEQPVKVVKEFINCGMGLSEGHNLLKTLLASDNMRKPIKVFFKKSPDIQTFSPLGVEV